MDVGYVYVCMGMWVCECEACGCAGVGCQFVWVFGLQSIWCGCRACICLYECVDVRRVGVRVWGVCVGGYFFGSSHGVNSLDVRYIYVCTCVHVYVCVGV